jgi:hypothetical protein
MKSAGELLSSFFSDHFDGGIMEKARGFRDFFSSWASLLETCLIPQAADHSRIVELERHVALVEADHPGWVQILQTKQRELLEALQRRYPGLEIRGLAFRYAAALTPERRGGAVKTGVPAAEAPHRPERAAPAVRDNPFERIDDKEFIASLKRLKQDIIERESSA